MRAADRNFNVLSKLYPRLAEELKREDPREDRPNPSGVPEEDEIRIEAGPSGYPALLVGGRHVHSPRDPVREAERLTGFLAGESSGGPRTPIVILGFGLGYTAEAAAKAAPGRPLVIVESRKALLRRALEERDLSSFLTGNTLVFVVGGSGESAVRAALGLFAAAGPPAVIRNRALMAADETWYAGVERGIRSYTGRTQVNSATLRRFGRRWVRNLGRNLEAIRDLPGIARLEGILAASAAAGTRPQGGIPVFLAAAGPSLDRAAPLLGEIRKRCVITAVDTSLRFLLRRGAAPDFVVSVDPQYWNFRHLDRCAAPESWLVTEPSVYPPALRHCFRGIFLCRSNLPLGRFIEDRVDPKGALGAGGSVAASAWDFARVLGAPAVWIAGLDLAFPELKTHFKGALFENRSHGESRRFAPAETWALRALRDGEPFSAPGSGGMVLTDRRLSLYASWFENRFREFPAVKNYRLGNQGLLIPGLESVEAEAILDLPERREEITALLEGVYGKIEEEFRRGGEDRARCYRDAKKNLLAGLETVRAEAAAAAALAQDCPAGEGPSPASWEEGIRQRLEEARRNINSSEVKAAAVFLLPPELWGDVQGPAEGAFTPYRTGQSFRALAEAAEYQIRALAD
jgi:hypothetical protein